MSEQHKPIVKAAVMRWAREQGGMTVEGAAHRTGLTVEQIMRVEDAAEYAMHCLTMHCLTIAELRKLADVYCCPVWYFYLPHPPRRHGSCSAIASFGDDHGDNSTTFFCSKLEASNHEGLHVESGVRYGVAYTLTWSGNAAEEQLQEDLQMDPEVEADVEALEVEEDVEAS